MKHLILVRHGVTDWNEDGRLMGRADIELNARGWEQARRVADVLTSRSIAAVYSSPQLRTRQTAAPIGEALAREVVIEPGVDEVWLSDAWTGKTLAELRGDAELDRVIEDPTHRCDAIESAADVQARAVAALEKLRSEHENEAVVVVSHGDPLRVIVAHYLGLGLRVFRRLGCDNGSVSEIAFNRRGPRLTILNWRP